MSVDVPREIPCALLDPEEFSEMCKNHQSDGVICVHAGPYLEILCAVACTQHMRYTVKASVCYLAGPSPKKGGDED